MKKWMPILALSLSLTWLTGCQSQGKTEEGEPIEAMYIQKGEDFEIFVDVATGMPFTATIPEGTEELTTGDLVEIYGNGVMAESYPGQYPGVTRMVVKSQGEEADAEKYQSLLDEIYHEPDPAEPPYLNLEYTTELANVSAVTTRGGVSWSYVDEEGQNQAYNADVAFILDWKELNDIRLSEPTDVELHFSREAEDVKVLRYERTEPGQEKQSESGETEGELIEVTREEQKGENAQYVLKDLSKEGVYLVKAEFEQGTVEYGFEVLAAQEK